MMDILVVEDGLHERERLKRLFSAASFSVATAESVREAERLLRHDDFRLVVLDVGLGDKSGSYLFELIKRSGKSPYVVVLTGNPSLHLKQRFIEEGAVAYIVKASPQAENDSLLETVQSLLGAGEVQSISGIPLDEFLRQYINPASRELFLDVNNEITSCAGCGANEFLVTFAHKTQLPPLIEGRVICAKCNVEMDPKVG